MENTFELVIIPSFGISSVGVEIELARRLGAHDPRISVVVLIPEISISELKATEEVHISVVRLPALPEGVTTNTFPPQNITDHMDAYKPMVKEIIQKRFEASNGCRRIAGFVLDIFCSPMADLAHELEVPFYFMIPSSASTASFYLHFEGPLDGHLPETPLSSLQVAGFRMPLPESAWPVVIRNKNTASLFLRHIKKIRASKGVLVNTFTELEPDVIRSLSQYSKVPPVYPVGPIVNIRSLSQYSKVPPVYPVGPIVNMGGQDSHVRGDPLFDWLDAQPPRSVVFLCFGTMGAFNEDQVREIATGLERSGHRFLWSLRKKPEGWKRREYDDDFNQVLPEGFLERTGDVGRLVRWVPQTEVLSHPSIGASVMHSDWISLLDCLWLGVPVAVWPLFADQHVCAYHWVNEAGLGTEMCMDDSSYIDNPTHGNDLQLVDAAKVEAGIRRVMEGEEGVAVRKRLAEMTHIFNKAHLHGGSSNHSITTFINDVIRNVLL